MVNRCGRCPGWWQGERTSHCGTCHRTFSGVTAFDAHRRNGGCVDPATLGMAPLAGRPYECWGFPSEETDR